MTTPVASAVAPAGTDRHWALFADWCTATDQPSLPATSNTILAFLGELPAGPATVRRRLLAVDAAHRHAGYPPPSAAPAFDALLRPARPVRFDPELVAAALAVIPIGGWPAGIVGRRDAALVALVCSAGLTRRQIQALRTPACAHTDDQAGSGTTPEPALPAVVPADYPGACPACALTRWQWVAATTATAGWRAVRNILADLGEDSADSVVAHDCNRSTADPELIEDHQWAAGRSADDGVPIPLFCAIDRHGTPQSSYPLSTRSITAIVARRLAAAHADRQPPAMGDPDRVDTASLWDGEDHARVVAARRAATDRLASFEAELDEADAYAEAILAGLGESLAQPG